MEHLNQAPTGRITYRELRELLNKMSDEQLDMDLTIEDPFCDECYAAELRIIGEEHETLDEWHPVITALPDDHDYMHDDYVKQDYFIHEQKKG